MLKLSIMQPYFFPYIGYFQLLYVSDIFVIYDNIEYTKKGWINRNKLLKNGKDYLFTIPLKKDSDFRHIRERSISDDFNKNKFLNQIKESYIKSPHYKTVYPIIEKIVLNNESNLFDYILYSVKQICEYLEVEKKIIKSSTVDIDHSLKSKDKILSICKALKAKIYINTIGGFDLYSKDDFNKSKIALKFIKPKGIKYNQFDHEFVPQLSIIDTMMFNDKKEIRSMLSQYELL